MKKALSVIMSLLLLTSCGHRSTSSGASDDTTSLSSISGSILEGFSSSSTPISSESIFTNIDVGKLPAVQNAIEMWTSFGGHPEFTDPSTCSALIISDLYANYCKSMNMRLEPFTDKYSGNSWINADELEAFYTKYFSDNLNTIRDSSDYYNKNYGYLYPLIFPARPDSVDLISVEGNSVEATFVLCYKFILPLELYGEDAGVASAMHTVTIQIEDNNYRYLAAKIIDERI